MLPLAGFHRESHCCAPLEGVFPSETILFGCLPRNSSITSLRKCYYLLHMLCRSQTSVVGKSKHAPGIPFLYSSNCFPRLHLNSRTIHSKCASRALRARHPSLAKATT